MRLKFQTLWAVLRIIILRNMEPKTLGAAQIWFMSLVSLSTLFSQTNTQLSNLWTLSTAPCSLSCPTYLLPNPLLPHLLHLLRFDSPASTRHPADSRTCCLARRLDLEDAIIHTSKVSSHSTHDHQLSNTGGIPSVQCLNTINLGIPFWTVSELCLPQRHENETCVRMRFKLLIGSTCSMIFL